MLSDDYPKPPFQSQQQPWLGLAGKMQPRPDHGEQSYRGWGRLAGRKALVTGGDSGMGRAAELAALYVLLASEEATFSTGQVFGAVGGRGGP